VRWLSQLRPAEPILELEAATNFLSTLRCFLHYRSGRDNNQLTFDAQEEITEQPFIPHSEPAVWMRDYYLHARAIHRAATRAMESSEPGASGLLGQFRNWRSRVSTSEFTVSRERVLLRNPHLVEQEPEALLRLFIFLARHGIRLAADSARRIEGSLAAMSAKLAALPKRWSLFKEVLSLPHAALAMEAMHETGVLTVLIPEWAAIECLVVRDFYHRYTVDEHSLVAVQALGDLPGAKDGPRRRFAVLLEEVEERHLLLLALLLHDTGKAARSGQHVDESLRLAASAMERLGVPEDARKTVAFLIERHLDLSGVMSARDLDEPSTARFLAERCDTVERLRQLVLLTYADISAVNPSAMSPWRLEQLWSVHLAADAELTRELDTERIASPPASTPEMAAFLEGFPTRYARVHSEAELQAHLALHDQARTKGVAVEVSKRNGTYSLALAAQDRPALLSSIAGVLAGFGMNILKAEAFSNRRGMILDTFVFEDPKRTLDLNPTEVDRLRLSMERVVLGKTDVKQFLQNRPRPAPPSKGSRVRTAVTFNSEVSATSTLVEVVAQDRPGLLYDLTSTISSAGCNIEVVLVDTEAHKALDVFYVTSGGKKLSAGQLVTLKESLLRACRG
jgi:[protein-PII] uridylyltransferase